MNSVLHHRYFMRLGYDGSRYHGWQLQKNALSVQQVLTEALGSLLGVETALVGCGRTDTGVHAREYFAHFEHTQRFSLEEMEHLAYRLNRFLPPDIAVFRVLEVPPDLHARFSAVSRTYRYYIHTFKDPFLQNYSWFVPEAPDMGLMDQGALLLMEYEDFTSFSKLHSAAKTNICHVTRAGWDRKGHRMTFTISADRFLRNMVRAIVGTLVELGQGKMDLDALKRVIEAKNRSDAGQSVPAHGLYLEKVDYPAQAGVW